MIDVGWVVESEMGANQIRGRRFLKALRSRRRRRRGVRARRPVAQAQPVGASVAAGPGVRRRPVSQQSLPSPRQVLASGNMTNIAELRQDAIKKIQTARTPRQKKRWLRIYHRAGDRLNKLRSR